MVFLVISGYLVSVLINLCAHDMVSRHGVVLTQWPEVNAKCSNNSALI